MLFVVDVVFVFLFVDVVCWLFIVFCSLSHVVVGRWLWLVVVGWFWLFKEVFVVGRSLLVCLVFVVGLHCLLVLLVRVAVYFSLM